MVHSLSECNLLIAVFVVRLWQNCFWNDPKFACQRPVVCLVWSSELAPVLHDAVLLTAWLVAVFSDSSQHISFFLYFVIYIRCLLVLWCCWLGGRKGIRPVKKLSGGVVICLEQGADLHMAQLMPLPLTVSVKSRLVLPFWYWLTWVVPDKGPLNMSVHVCCYSCQRCSYYLQMYGAVSWSLVTRWYWMIG